MNRRRANIPVSRRQLFGGLRTLLTGAAQTPANEHPDAESCTLTEHSKERLHAFIDRLGKASGSKGVR